jgi:hypothetical protein
MTLGNMRGLMKRLILFVAIVAMSAAQAEPTFQLDASGNRVVSLSNLYDDPGCSSGRIRGKVVKRQFDDGAIHVIGFVIENANGSRDFVNVGVDTENLNMNAKGWVLRGLQTLLAEGHVVDPVIKACGAAGRFLNLDAVREVPPWER